MSFYVKWLFQGSREKAHLQYCLLNPIYAFQLEGLITNGKLTSTKKAVVLGAVALSPPLLDSRRNEGAICPQFG
jgi:hypothetical protein